MKTLRREPFPFEAVRDLLGILRALWLAERERNAGAARLDRIAGVAGELRMALDVATDYETGTLGHAAAWERAERATLAVGELVDCVAPLEPVVRAGIARVRRK